MVPMSTLLPVSFLCAHALGSSGRARQHRWAPVAAYPEPTCARARRKYRASLVLRTLRHSRHTRVSSVRFLDNGEDEPDSGWSTDCDLFRNSVVRQLRNDDPGAPGQHNTVSPLRACCGDRCAGAQTRP
jgi:hypothetical protein